MRNTQRFSIHFIPRIKKGKYHLYCRINANKTRSEIYLQKIINIEDWDKKNGSAKPLTPELIQLNLYLTELREQLTRLYQAMNIDPSLVTAHRIKEHHLGKRRIEGNQTMTLKDLIELHNTMMLKILDKGTLKNYYSTQKYIVQFLNKEYKNKDLYLCEIQPSFITKLEQYIRNNPLKKGDPCTNNGTMKHLERLKKMMKWAFVNEWAKRDPFVFYKLKMKKSSIQFLEPEELLRLEERSFPSSALARIRDLFIFSCYTGLSYCDLFALAPHQIIPALDGMKWIKSKRMKTDVLINIPLLKPALRIAMTYLQESVIEKRLTIFPTISNQKLNAGLKAIAKVCGIKKHLTFHMARHTFATTVTLMNGMPIETISALLGHTKITTTMVYSHVINPKIAKDVDALQQKINQLSIVKP